MSKKKSFMSIKNILTEGAIGNFLKGLFKGKKALQKDVAKYKKKLNKNIKDFNDTQSRLEKAIEKQYGKKVNLPRQTFDDVVDNAR